MKLFRIGIVVFMLLASALTINACAVKPPIEDYVWVLTTYGAPGNFQNALATRRLPLISAAKIIR